MSLKLGVSWRNVYKVALADTGQMPKEKWFEGLLSVASEAYECETGQPFAYTAKFDYETGSNAAGWPL